MGYTVDEEQPPLLWRIARTDPPTETDFLSNQERGIPRRRSEPEELWSGLSTFDNVTVAAEMARRWGLGNYLVGLALDPVGPIRWAKTRGESHYTLWGRPADMLARVVEIRRVESGAEGK